MSPDTPGTPDEGTPDEAKLAQDAAESKAEPKPEAKKKPAAAKKKPAAKKPSAKEVAKKAAPKTDDVPAEAAEEPTPAPKAKAKPKAKAAAKSEPKPAPSRRRSRNTDENVIVRAHARYVRSSARKARLVCDAVRGKSVDEAKAILRHHPRAVAEAWEKLLDSAIANAENNHDLNGEDLKVHAIFADEGPTLKRFRPRAMGRATRIRKRTSHLTIQLTPKKGG